MPRFHSLRIVDVRRESPDCVSVAFEVPEELKADFAFTQGQHISLRTHIGGEEIRRSYSLCSSPLEGEWRVAIKRIPDGLFSNFAHEKLKAGEHLDVMVPKGNFFTQLDPGQQKHYVAFAAGSGITPIMSIMKTVLHTEPGSRFSLFYANKYVSSIIFKEEIEGLKNQFLNRLQVHHFLTQEILDSPLFNGRLTKEKLTLILKGLLDIKQVDEVFLCGPEDMIFDLEEGLLEAGLGKKHIHKELFVSKTALKKSKQIVQPDLNGRSYELVVKDGGKSMRFEWKQGADNILDAALMYGADLPYACKGGVCCTCKAKLLEGKVDMAVNYALEESEVEAGYILTCQSRPLTEKVVVDFDAAL